MIEERLKESLEIPVFHDDQHGTAIIATAALLNALEVTGKKASRVRVVFSGAGAFDRRALHPDGRRTRPPDLRRQQWGDPRGA
jgi:hypothetical protein